MPRMTPKQIEHLEVDKRFSIIERTELAKSLIAESKRSLEDEFAAQVKRYGLPDPMTQFKFADAAIAYVWDFAWPQYKLLVEINGGIYQRQRTGHASIRGLVRDYTKLNAATARHWWSMTFETKAVESGEAVLTVQEFILTYEQLTRRN